MEMIGHRTPAENERTHVLDTWDAMVLATQATHSVIASSHFQDDAKDENGTVNTVSSSPRASSGRRDDAEDDLEQKYMTKIYLRHLHRNS